MGKKRGRVSTIKGQSRRREVPGRRGVTPADFTLGMSSAYLQQRGGGPGRRLSSLFPFLQRTRRNAQELGERVVPPISSGEPYPPAGV